MVPPGRENPRLVKPRAIVAVVAVAAALGAGAVWAATTTSPFPDVPADHPRVEAIRYAKDEGLFLGFPDGNLRPDDELSEGQFTRTAERLYDLREAWTRAEWAQVLFSGLPSLAAASAAPAGAAPFPDVPGDHPRAEAIRYAKAEGLFLGYPDGTLRPDTELSGGQFAKTAKRLYDRYDVWTRADWAQVLFGGLPTLAPAAETTTTATTAPSVASSAVTTSAAPRAVDAPGVRYAIGADLHSNFFIHWTRPGWEAVPWRFRIVSPNRWCLIGDDQWEERWEGRYEEFDDGVDRPGPWTSWSSGWTNASRDSGWRCYPGALTVAASYAGDLGYFYVEIEWENGGFLRTERCFWASVSEPVPSGYARGFFPGYDSAGWLCPRPWGYDYRDRTSWPYYHRLRATTTTAAPPPTATTTTTTIPLVERFTFAVEPYDERDESLGCGLLMKENSEGGAAWRSTWPTYRYQWRLETDNGYDSGWVGSRFPWGAGEIDGVIDGGGKGGGLLRFTANPARSTDWVYVQKFSPAGSYKADVFGNQFQFLSVPEDVKTAQTFTTSIRIRAVAEIVRSHLWGWQPTGRWTYALGGFWKSWSWTWDNHCWPYTPPTTTTSTTTTTLPASTTEATSTTTLPVSTTEAPAATEATAPTTEAPADG